MTSAAPNRVVPESPIRARVAATLSAQPVKVRPAGVVPRRRFSDAKGGPPPTTLGQVFRAGLVLVVGLMLAPTPRLDGAPGELFTSVAQSK